MNRGYWLLTLMVGFIMLSLFSCLSEEEPDCSNSGITPAVPEDRSMLLTSAIVDGCLYSFEYDKMNRLTSGVDSSGPFDIFFCPLRFVLYSTDDDVLDINVYDLETNENGYLTHMVMSLECVVEDTVIWLYKNFDFYYEGEYLSKIAVIDYDSLHYEYNYTWENGNLVKIQRDSFIHIFEYGADAKDNSRIYFPQLVNRFGNLSSFFYGGYLGKTSAKMPTKYIWGKYGVEFPAEKIDVMLDELNRVVGLKKNDKLWAVYAYDGKQAVWPEN